ncbi:hypothetical protein IEQ34_001420 [Dendrobium chrysotoxum]|uniref:Uncharacterized protein n=1 Tax=Dendrobium chrysotoxum TaxID=161865 RepID=A0AAV7HQE0_DENCH|nr:hypothetical protein IEQ34_001420 [Dendrobium chrysotoxum]
MDPIIQGLCSSFLSYYFQNKFSLSQSLKLGRSRRPASYPCIRALELDQNTVVTIFVGVVSISFGKGIPLFYETQIDSVAKRENTQPCFPCNRSEAQ